MFYPIDLLSRRQRGKLAPCWLAAMNNEKLFKRYYSSGAIKNINIVQTCNMILEAIQSRNSGARFSLYLASQLMYGTTKIYSYQIKYYQKEAFEFQKKLYFTPSSKKKGIDYDLHDKGDGFGAFENIECPDIELPFTSQNFLDTQLRDLHILSDEGPNDKLQMALRDATVRNFGCLKDEDLEFMLLRLGDFHDLWEKLVGKSSKEKDISEKMSDMTIAEEVHRQSSQETHNPMLVDISKSKSKSREKLSLTPQKRQPQQIQSETPTKKRRLFSETVAMTVPPVEDMAASAPELPVEETRMLISPQQKELDMELESLHSSYFVVNRHLKKNKIIDQKIALTDGQLWKWRQDVKIHCKQSDKRTKRLTPAIDLFKQPSHLPKRWNGRLSDLFVDRITEPFMNVDKDIAPAELVQSHEAIMKHVEETISKLPMKEVSTFAKTDVAIAVEPVDSIEKTATVLSISNIARETDVLEPPEVLPEVPHMSTLKEDTSTVEHRDQEKTSNISNIDESLEDIKILLERQRHSSETRTILDSSVISSKFSEPELTSHDILAQLEVFWLNEPCVKFNELIPKDTYTREDAATVFCILLELHAQKKLVLQQAECFRTLRIWKYEKS